MAFPLLHALAALCLSILYISRVGTENRFFSAISVTFTPFLIFFNLGRAEQSAQRDGGCEAAAANSKHFENVSGPLFYIKCAAGLRCCIVFLNDANQKTTNDSKVT